MGILSAVFRPRVTIVIVGAHDKYLYWKALVKDSRGNVLHTTARSVGYSEPEQDARLWSEQNHYVVKEVSREN